MLAGHASHPRTRCASTVGWTACIVGVGGAGSISGQVSHCGVVGDRKDESLLCSPRQKYAGLEGGGFSPQGWK
jgi:hypothetical protein